MARTKKTARKSEKITNHLAHMVCPHPSATASVSRMSETGWQDWLVSVGVALGPASEYAKIFIDNDVDEVQILKQMTDEQLEFKLQIRIGTITKIRQHFVDFAPKYLPISLSASASNRKFSSSNKTDSSELSDKSSYRWEWEQSDGNIKLCVFKQHCLTYI